jgi:hypothetical protein
MNKRRRTEITIETKLLVLRYTRRRAPLYCAVCLSPTPLIAPEEAATPAGASTRTIYALVESGQIHFRETAEGKLLVCPNLLPLFN